MKAVIFCVETNKQANTDWVYIKATLDKYYMAEQKNSHVRFDRIYMGSKNKYKSKQVVNEITSWKRVYKDELVVVYCIDTDNYESNPDHKKEFEEISLYCKNRGYELVWFCHDIEEVYWKRSVDNTAKKKESIQFSKTKQIEKVDKKNLVCGNIRSGFSNILCVLEEIIN